MLHPTAVPPELLSVLRQVRQVAENEGFSLAGGTSLAFRFGHRISVDLDFFCTRDFDPQLLADRLGVSIKETIGVARGTLQLAISGVKVEFLRHNFPKLQAEDRLDGIRLWSLADVAAMKLNAIVNAIVNRGSKKDFFDLCALLRTAPLSRLLERYRDKYQPGSMMMALRSLAWFDDADSEPDPLALDGTTWAVVKETVFRAIRDLDA